MRILADVASGDDVVEHVFQSRNQFGTQTGTQTIWSYATTSDTAYYADVKVLAFKGTATKDAACYRLRQGAKNISGTLTLLGTVVKEIGEGAGVTAWDSALAVSSTNLTVQFMPDASNPTTVHMIVYLMHVAS